MNLFHLFSAFRRMALFLWALCGCFCGAAFCAEYVSEKHPIYVGAEVCGKCHTGPDMGHQTSQWRMTAHARAYAALAMPEAALIALLSGIPEPPHEAKMCLGCHATGAETEDWERMENFHIEDGLQCEGCHGPGSEYAEAAVMQDRKLAEARGLKVPDKQKSCNVCHRPKGSHDAVLKKTFDWEKAWSEIKHPTPPDVDFKEPETGTVPPNAGPNRKFLGVMKCAECHRWEAMGFQFSKWRLSSHARAFAVLTTPKAMEIARAEGLREHPQKSAKCLKCHSTGAGHEQNAFLERFRKEDGVQCESCHGPGSEYAVEKIMKDSSAAAAAGLIRGDEQTCRTCHENAHGKPFDFKLAMESIAHPVKAPPLAEASGYKNPLNMAFSPDGKELWIACEASDSVIVVDVRSRRKVAELPAGGQPADVTFEPSGKRVFVSNRLEDSVSVFAANERKLVATLPVGDEPHGLLTDAQGKNLYVLNTSIDSISVFDLATLKETKRLTASRSPWSLARSPDGKKIVVTSALSRFVAPRSPLMSELTVVNTEKVVVEDRAVASAANLLQGVAWHPSGEYALFTLLRTKNLVPMTRLLRGWTISNGLGILWADGRVDQVLLDLPDISFPDPADVIITPDGKHALVTSSSSDRIAVVDLGRLTSMLNAATDKERERIIPNHLGKPVEFIEKFISVPGNPRGIVCSPDGSLAFVATTLDDSITLLDLKSLERIERIDLGGNKEISIARKGEKLFNNASIAFQRQFSCHSCHPDGHIDGVVYDIEADGIGISPVDNRTLRGINDMAPYKWEGTNPSLKRQCGPRLAVFFTRIQPFTPDELAAVDYYICTIPRPPNRYRKLNEPLSDAQRRGKAVFERTITNDGRAIPADRRCTNCHPPPLFTDGLVHDVGTRTAIDRTGLFDSPHLNNIYDSAPYLHNGSSPSLEEIWTRFNPDDLHGVTNDMTKDQLNDLVEYLKTL